MIAVLILSKNEFTVNKISIIKAREYLKYIKSRKLQSLSACFFFPLALIAFIYGVELYGIDSRYGLGTDYNLFDIIIFLISSFGSSLGIIFLFLPIGVIVDLYQVIYQLELIKIPIKNIKKKQIKNYNNFTKNTIFYYLTIYDELNNFVKLHSVLISVDVYLYFLINLKSAR